MTTRNDRHTAWVFLLPALVCLSILLSSTVASALAHNTTATTSATTLATPASDSYLEKPPVLQTTPISSNSYTSDLLPPGYETPLQLQPEDHFYLSRPLPPTVNNRVLTDFPYGSDYGGEMNTHTGVDIPAPRGTPVLAAADGTVAWSGVGLFGHFVNRDDPYGNAVSIRHDFGYLGKAIYTAYAHMDELDVVAGEHVKKGQMIGKVGDTGNATGPHLHFEVREGEDSFFMTRNPELWLVPPEGYGVLAGRIESIDYVRFDKYPFVIRRVGTKDEWSFLTYIPDLAHSDDVYQENFVVSDLPAGEYQADIWVWWQHYLYTFDIVPGMTTCILFHAGNAPLLNPPLNKPAFTAQ